MKNKYHFPKIVLFFSLFLVAVTASAQIVNIPDPALKTKLLDHAPIIDTNDDGEIQVSEAQAFTGNLNLAYLQNNSQITDATGINEFVNASGINLNGNLLTSINVSAITGLDSLKVQYNQLNSLDVSQNTDLIKLNASINNLTSFTTSSNDNLIYLDLGNNPNLGTLDTSLLPNLENLLIGNINISSIDLSSLSNLKYLNIAGNPITSIDLSANINLEYLWIVQTNLVELDVSNNPVLEELHLWENSQLTYVNLKNGNNHNMNLGEGFYEVPNLQAACVDEIPLSFPHAWLMNQVEDQNISLSTHCNSSPGQFNTISGNLKVDMGAGCADASAVSLPNVLVKSIDDAANTTASSTFTDDLGEYSLYVGQGTFTSSADFALPPYYSISPASHSSTFTTYGNNDQADFCVNSSQNVNDLNVTILPLTGARPGFNTDYKIICENMGTATASGQVVFQFDPAKQSFVSAVPAETSSTANTVTFDFTNLQPFHTREFEITLLTEQPPTVNLGDVLTLTATVTPDTNDYTPDNNTFQLDQTTVGSYDPNDKQVLEGDEIEIAAADEYLHYLIRFQNTGTASAINVVISDALNDLLDWESIKMVSASHDYRVEISDGKYVEFIFENINLPHETANEPGSHGYVAFKIKPIDNIALGDIITGKAAIYFDFNAPIITNTVSTEIVENLSAENVELATTIQCYPNPTNGILNISSVTELEKVEVFSLTGTRLLVVENNLEKINLQGFSEGIYFLKITDKNGGEMVKKIVKK